MSKGRAAVSPADLRGLAPVYQGQLALQALAGYYCGRHLLRGQGHCKFDYGVIKAGLKVCCVVILQLGVVTNKDLKPTSHFTKALPRGAQRR